MRLLVFILTGILLLLLPTPILAINSPLEVSNNKYGIHIIDENDLENAAALVNSSGGDWGYVTLVITENERILSKWQQIFEKMSNLHLIPILRVATKLNGTVWEKPSFDEIIHWSDFLSSLTWITKNRYLIIFNEPNHAKEWGGLINPEEYTDILASFSATLKQKSDDFFILPAGLDSSAPDSNLSMDQSKFIKRMIAHNKDIFNTIDGWTSHSYPNPGFKGKVVDNGRGTIRNFQWELYFLKSLNINRDLPVFITETGWPHSEGIIDDNFLLPADIISDNIAKAAQSVWLDENIVAITPFILNYQSMPFAHFSWQKLSSALFYPQFDSYRSIPKVKGQPHLVFRNEKKFTNNNILSSQNTIVDKTDYNSNMKSNTLLGMLNLTYQLLTDFIKKI